MRFVDSLKLALHNIWNNKLRSLLTVSIVLVISALIMVMYVFAVSFVDNISAVQRENFAERGTDYSFSGIYEPGLNAAYSNAIRQSELDVFFAAIVDNPGIIGELWSYPLDGLYHSNNDVSADVYGSEITLTSFSVPMPAADGAVVAGRTWSDSDRGTNVVFVSEYYAEQVLMMTGGRLKIGDPVFLACGDNTAECVIGGIYDPGKLAILSYYQWRSSDIYVDTEFAARELDAKISNVYMFFKPNSANFDFDKTYSRIVKLYNAINDHPDIRQPKAMFPEIERLMGNVRFRVSIKMEMDLINIVSALIQGVLAILGVFILIISVGSVANTIIMSTDKSKKFIGLMKAMGLKPRALNRIINLEAVILIAAGVVLAFILLYALSSVISSAMAFVLVKLMIPVPEGFIGRLIVTYPAYVPPVTAAAFILMALLSARGSMRRLNNMDVISIMNEVA